MPSNEVASRLSSRSVLFLHASVLSSILSIHDHLSLPVVVRHRPHGRLEVGRSLLLDLVGERVDLEAVEARHELVGRPLGPVLGVHHEQHVREPRPEVRAVRVVVSVKQAQV